MRRLRSGAIGALALFALALGPARAGTLAPKRASDLVTLSHSAPPGCGFGNGHPMNVRALSDGTTEVFEVPPKQALVVTRATFYVSTAEGARVFLDVGSAGSTARVAQTSGPSDFFDRVLLEFDFGPGLAIGPGQSLCAFLTGLNASATLLGSAAYGYLAPAK